MNRNPAPYFPPARPDQACAPMRWRASIQVGDVLVVKEGFVSEAQAQAWINEWSKP